MKNQLLIIFIFGVLHTSLLAQTDNCQLYQKIVQQEMVAYNNQDIEVLEKLYAPNIRFATNGEKAEGRKAVLALNLKNFTENDNLTMTLTDQICGENGITIFWTLAGFNKQAGISFSVEGVQFVGINADNQITEIRGQFDQLGAFLKGGYTLEPPK